MSTDNTQTPRSPRSRLVKRPDDDTVVEDIPQYTPVGQVIHHYARQTRFRVSNDLIDRRAQTLHAQNSYDPWQDLTDRDRELWRHVARVQLEE